MNPIANLAVESHRLSNGLRVLIRRDDSAPVVAIFTHVLAGYFDEPDEWVGISHVLEHMYFKGTPTRGPGAIARATKDAGGYLNASTIYDHTSYYTVLPSSALEQGLDIQSDALLNSLIDAEELRKELLVIIQEAKRKLDNPAAIAREALYELMFDEHRMRRWRIGTEQRLRDFTRADVAGFFERYYRSGLIVLVIAGAVDETHALELVRARYEGLRAGAPTRERGPAEAREPEFRYRELSGDVVQTRIEFGWHTAATLHEDTPALDVLAVVLGQGRASHLYRTVREAGLASGVSAHNYTPTELGVFGITAETEPADAEGCLAGIVQTVERIRSGHIGADDVARAQSILEARLLRGLETMEGQANFLAEWEGLGDWRLGFDYMAQMRRLTADDLTRAARSYLALERAALVLYRPATAQGTHVTVDTLRSHAR
ncbi:MAG TPA: pitrilysin family protein [Longimicrobiales bacterium]